MRRAWGRGRGRERPRDLGELLARKRELVGRAAAQREALVGHLSDLAPALSTADRALAVGRTVFALAARGLALWSGARVARRLLGPCCTRG